MNLKPLELCWPSNGEPFTVYCSRCSRPVSSTDVMCDLDAHEPGAYYCQRCAALIKIAQELNL